MAERESCRIIHAESGRASSHTTKRSRRSQYQSQKVLHGTAVPALRIGFQEIAALWIGRVSPYHEELRDEPSAKPRLCLPSRPYKRPCTSRSSSSCVPQSLDSHLFCRLSSPLMLRVVIARSSAPPPSQRRQRDASRLSLTELVAPLSAGSHHTRRTSLRLRVRRVSPM